MDADHIRRLIQAALPEAEVRVSGAVGVHFDAEVVSATFAGLRPLQRHRVVYAALGDLMGGAIHALALRTLTPEERADAAPGL